MGFQGTFKGTLKENFDRMMNPRKFLNEMDESNINELDNNSNDIVGKIMRWEEGEMSDDETIDFFSELITSGQINGLQGVYGRTARSLIDAGYLDRSGKVLMHTGGEMDESNINELGNGDDDGGGKYTIVNGTAYDKKTPQPVIDALEAARQSRQRITVDLGDPETGKSWGERYDITGTVGRSTGMYKIPILVHNVRSTGGGGLLTANIIAIKTSRNGVFLYKHPNYQPVANIVQQRNPNMEEVAMPNLTESYNRLQLLNKKLSKKNLNEVGFDQNGNPMGFDNSEEGYGDDPIDSRPKKGDAVYLQTGYQDVASRIMYIDATHIYWKTDSVNTIETGSKGGVYHIGQLRNKQLYNDLLTWMNTGDKTALETTKYKDI